MILAIHLHLLMLFSSSMDVSFPTNVPLSYATPLIVGSPYPSKQGHVVIIEIFLCLPSGGIFVVT